MSMSTLFASGIAYGLPQAKLWAFMGDGAFVMNPAMLMVERDLNLSDLRDHQDQLYLRNSDNNTCDAARGAR